MAVPPALPGLLFVQQFLLAGVGDEPFALCLLARELARAADRFGLFAVFALRRLFVRAPLLHLTKHAFALHFLFQNTKRLIDIVVAHKNLQLMFLYPEEAADKRNDGRV